MSFLFFILPVWFVLGVCFPAILAAVAILLSERRGRTAKVGMICTSVWAVVVFCAVFSFWYYPYLDASLDYQATIRLREKYPLVSISRRLDYESSRGGQRWVMPAHDFHESPVEQSLQYFEDGKMTPERDAAIYSLHVRTLEYFIAEQENGSDRLPAVRGQLEEFIQNTGPRLVPTPAAIKCAKYNSHNKEGACDEPYDAFHIDGLIDMFDTSRFGYVIDRDHVAGFEAHRITKVPTFESSDETRPPITLISLELVSLIRHANPVAYVSHTLPNLDCLSELETRSLSEFERTGLVRMQSNEDISLSRDGDRVHMIGSIRARSSCLRCHDAQQGELLGALTYEFRLKNAD